MPPRTRLALKAAEAFTQTARASKDVNNPDFSGFFFCDDGQFLGPGEKMADVMSCEKRSALMSRVRGTNTGPELIVRKLLWHSGLRFRLHAKELPGKPDIIFPRWRAAVFVHGCFWHRHQECSLFRLPRTRPEFWDEKLRKNQERDAKSLVTLRRLGWRVAVVWECAVKLDPMRVGHLLASWIRSEDAGIELLQHGVFVVRRDLG